MSSSTFIPTYYPGGQAVPAPAGYGAWRVAVSGGTVTLSLWADAALGNATGKLIASIDMSTAEAAALGDALGGSSGTPGAATGP